MRNVAITTAVLAVLCGHAAADWPKDIQDRNGENLRAWENLRRYTNGPAFSKTPLLVKDEELLLDETASYQKAFDRSLAAAIGHARAEKGSVLTRFGNPLEFFLDGKPVVLGNTIAEVSASWALNGKALARQAMGGRLRGATDPLQWVTLDKVRKELKRRGDALLVDYVRYIDAADTPSYAAWVIPPDGMKFGGKPAEVQMIDLGSAAVVESKVQSMSGEIREKVRRLKEYPNWWIPFFSRDPLPAGTLDDQFSRKDAFVLSLFALSSTLLGEVGPNELALRRWYISPAAELWLVPFPALPLKVNLPGKVHAYSLEDRGVSYVISGRDLVLMASPPGPSAAGNSLVMGNPNFDSRVAGNVPPAGPRVRRASWGAADAETAEAGQGSDDKGRVTTACFKCFRPCTLPQVFHPCWPQNGGRGFDGWNGGGGTTLGSDEGPFRTLAGVPEVTEIAQDIANHLIPSNLLLGDLASEPRFQSLTRPPAAPPKAVAFVTHAFYLPQKIGGPPKDPLSRCGLALAGVNVRLGLGLGSPGFSHEIDSRVAGDPDDGLLTGREVVGAKLAGTELALLVACETGVGDISRAQAHRNVSGDSVAALRHAFTMAGARGVVATSWDVASTEAKVIVREFITQWPAKKNDEALWSVQRRLIRLNVHPFHWASYSLTGERN